MASLRSLGGIFNSAGVGNVYAHMLVKKQQSATIITAKKNFQKYLPAPLQGTFFQKWVSKKKQFLGNPLDVKKMDDTSNRQDYLKKNLHKIKLKGLYNL